MASYTEEAKTKLESILLIKLLLCGLINWYDVSTCNTQTCILGNSRILTVIFTWKYRSFPLYLCELVIGNY